MLILICIVTESNILNIKFMYKILFINTYTIRYKYDPNTDIF